MEPTTIQTAAPDSIPAFPELLTPAQLAEHLSVSVRHLDHLRARRLIPFVKLGRVIRFDRTKVVEAISSLTVLARAGGR